MAAMISRAAVAATVAWCVLGAVPAAAHPHVWVTSKSRVIYEKGTVTAIEQSWIFDEFYSAMAVQGLDKNNDGQYSREELAELAKINMDGLKEFGFFTYAKAGETALELGAPANAYLDYSGGILTLNFTLPMKNPAAPKDFTFATYDPSFFIAFELAKDDAVTLFGAPANCGVGLDDQEAAPVPGAARPNDTLTGAFTEQFGSAAVAGTKWAKIECKNS